VMASALRMHSPGFEIGVGTIGLAGGRKRPSLKSL
jgi:hypothetical protein